MITRMTQEEKTLVKTMVENLAKRYSKRLNVSEEVLSKILSEATIEIYQEKPFTTTIIKKTVNGRQVRGAGFTKYNLNDAKMGDKYAWTDTKGKIMSLSRAYRSFISEMVRLDVLTSKPAKASKTRKARKARKVRVKAVVKSAKTEETAKA